MSIVLYELAAADPEVRFSPYCWRTRLALAHKGLSCETRPWRFTEKAALAFSGQGDAAKVPVLTDGERIVVDSWAIALYLEETRPEAPTLFGGPGGIAATRFLSAWTLAALQPGIASLIVTDVLACLDPRDRDYFRRTREARYGRSLEEVVAGREERVAGFRESLAPLRLALREAPFLGGEAPLYGDYVVFGAFQWARCTSDFALLAEDDPVSAWIERMLDLHGGIARAAKRAVPAS